jgi:hypothetical protein
VREFAIHRANDCDAPAHRDRLKVVHLDGWRRELLPSIRRWIVLLNGRYAAPTEEIDLAV